MYCLARCYFEATENDCTIDQIKPGLKSIATYFFIYLRGTFLLCTVDAKRAYALLITRREKYKNYKY